MLHKLQNKIAALLSVPSDPHLLVAQCRALSRHIPILYCLLLVNTWAITAGHIHSLPIELGVYAPLALTMICIMRLLLWWRSRNLSPTPQQARRMLVQTNWLAVLLAAAFVLWSLTLFPYGDPYMQGHVAFYMAITVIGCIFCLMHLRSAALIVALIVNTAFAIFFGISGHPSFISMTVNTVLVSAVMLILLSVYYKDFTRTVQAQHQTQALSNENFRLANMDSLTGLPNRRSFFSTLHQLHIQTCLNETRLSVGIMDLDGFKPVNDIHGHTLGDRLLNQVGQRLQAVCDNRFFLARLGGDEFSVIISHPHDDAELLRLGEDLCAAIRVPFAIDDVQVQISASIGFASAPDIAADAETLFEYADYALYASKKAQRGHAILFSRQHHEEICRNALIEQALLTSDLSTELSLAFQPIVDITTGKAAGFEALARWHNPTLGNIPAGAFIPIAERTGLISQITLLLLQKALDTAQLWPAHIYLSFNLSAHDINSPTHIRRILDIIQRNDINPSRLQLEITETAMTTHFDQAKAAVDKLRQLGCGLALDDFGTGYSSLIRLHTLPLTTIKVDRSFVTHIQDNPASYKIVRSLLSLSQEMGLDCVVEGVETGAELDTLRSLGCRHVQGYLFSRPLPASQLDTFF
ncbi:EAL domain-containing protein [Alcaligenaceae bacterium SJ-26]|nr:EAL domain-containing protein [Alcaligenaceae bacterium SJ-26]